MKVADSKLPAATPITGKSVSNRPSPNRSPAAMTGAPSACSVSTKTATAGASGWVASRSNPRCSFFQAASIGAASSTSSGGQAASSARVCGRPTTSGPTALNCADACARRRRDSPPATPSTVLSTTLANCSRSSIGRRLLTYLEPSTISTKMTYTIAAVGW
ncbi:hypothetical protein GCM10022235_19970 [Kribbella ginsengisoli]|uniref:Uncharacterized protein n=1 Tax=Kribbella ginsengisoli TaxID=363865 RepID=A0ABP6WKE0_9ACTN